MAEQQVNSKSGWLGTEREPLTFVFADLVNAARLWEQYAELMAEASPRYDALVRAMVAECGGRIFQTVGESHYLVFGDAATAIAAAAELQRRLLVTRWDARLGEMRARLALHSGAGQPRADGTYFAPQTLNRLSRILAATHGGQIIVSGATAEMARGKLTADIELRAMGVRRLRDLAAPETLYQVVTTDLPQNFPPLKTLDAHPSNLPAQPTALLGRERELAELGQRLRQPEVRLLTLTGPGGTGKTRLSLQLAADLLDEFADGCFFVPLAAVTAPPGVLAAIAQVLGLREEGGSLAETLQRALADKQMLLVLDNCEQVVAAAALLGDLLAAVPRLRIVATSREPFGLANEQEYAVPPLDLPSGGQIVNAATVAEYAAVQLFVQRAQAVKYDFVLNDADAALVVEICRQLDGLPLALELAAARIRQFSIAQLLERMSSRLALLRSQTRDRTPRQQSLEGMVAWSYELLDEAERKLFRRFAIFVSGADEAAVAAVCDPTGELRATNNLVHLAYKSLLRQDEMDGESSRFSMLHTIRDYALMRLQEVEYAVIAAQHATYYGELAETAANELRGPEQAMWLNRLEQEHDNLRAAIAWAATNAPLTALRLCAALWRFWEIRGYLSEGRRLIEATLAVDVETWGATIRPRVEQLQAAVLNGAGNLAFMQGDFAAARVYHEQALAMRRAIDDQLGVAASLNNLGNVAAQQGDYHAARKLYEDSLAIKRSIGDTAAIATSLNNLGNVTRALGDYKAAEELVSESLTLYRQMNDSSGVANSLISIGEIALHQADFAKARASYSECLNIANQLASKSLASQSYEGLGQVAYSIADYESAKYYYNEAYKISHESGYEVQEAYALIYNGILAGVTGEISDAYEQLISGLKLASSLGYTAGVVDALNGLGFTIAHNSVNPELAVILFSRAVSTFDVINWLPAERGYYERSLLQCRINLGEEKFAALWAEGAAMSLEDVVELALALVYSPIPSPSVSSPSSL